MSDGKYRSYKRIHRYQNALDVEKGKVSKERINSMKADKKAEKLIDGILKYPSGEMDEDMDELYIEYQEHMTTSHKDKNNARTHKNRLKEFQKRHGDEF